MAIRRRGALSPGPGGAERAAPRQPPWAQSPRAIADPASPNPSSATTRGDNDMRLLSIILAEAQEAGASPSSVLRAAPGSPAVSRELAMRSLGRATASAGVWLRSALPA